MLTGVEIASLVLTTLPIFISALEHYIDYLDPIEAFVEQDRQLSIQIRKFWNNVHHEQTLQFLLCPIVDPDQIASMIIDPDGESWAHDQMIQMMDGRKTSRILSCTL
jgi:hypothetical protein